MEEIDLKFSTRFLVGLLRLRWLVIAVWLAVVAGAASVYVARFQIDNSVGIWFLEDDPELANYRQSLETFGENEWTYLWLRTEAVFAPGFLRDLQDLARRIEGLDHVLRTVALTDAGGAGLDAAGRPQMRKYYPAGRGQLPDAGQVTAFRRDLGRSTRFREALLAGEGETFTLIAIQNDNLVRKVEPYRIALIDRVRELTAGYGSIRDSGIVGTTVVNAELNRAARRDMFVYYALIAVFVVSVGGLVLQSGRDLLVLIAVLAGTVLPVLGGAALLGLSFNLMTVMLPTILVTVGVSYLIHFLNEFHLERATGGGTKVVLLRTFRRLLKPGFWTTATTAVGFLSLTFSEVVPIRQVGWLAACGVGLAWLNTLTVTPVLLSLLWPAGAGGEAGRERLRDCTGGLLLLVLRPRPLIVCAFVAAVIAGIAALPRLRADTDYIRFFKSGNEVRTDYRELRSLGLPQSSLDITITLPEGTPISDLGRHRRLLAFEGDLHTLAEVRRIESLDRIVNLAHRDLVGDGAGEGPLLAELLMAAEARALPEAGEFLSRDAGTIRLRVLTDFMGTDALTAFRTKLAEVVQRSLPDDYEVAFTGTNLLWANMDAQVIRTQMVSIGVTSIVVIIVLPLVFRSLLLGLLGFAVSFVPIVCTLGIMAWMGLPVNIATCLLGGVVVGLAVDDTIYFVSRIREALDRGASIGSALRRATWSTGRAMIKTSAVLTGGFLTMAASDFLPSVYFGMFFAASIVIALLADLVLLPAMLRRGARFL